MHSSFPTGRSSDLLKLGLNTKVPKARARAVETSLHKTLKVWSSGIEVALGEFDKLDHLPNRILLCGGGSSLDMLMEALRENDWYKIGRASFRERVSQYV